MDGTPTDCSAVEEAVVFLSYFNDLPYPWPQGKAIYPLNEILLL
jgi:hypothetical protein